MAYCILVKMQYKWGRVIYQRKKNVANEIRPSVFASVPQSVFLVAASKTDVTSKTEYIKIKTDG